jgi:hypothetical protein
MTHYSGFGLCSARSATVRYSNNPNKFAEQMLSNIGKMEQNASLDAGIGNSVIGREPMCLTIKMKISSTIKF